MNNKHANQESISGIVRPILDAIPDAEMARCIRAAFLTEESSLKRVESVFLRLTARRWNDSTSKCFFRAWKDTHLSSGSVSALVCRLLQAATNMESPECLVAAHSLAKVIHEDLGLCGEPHGLLYERLATRCCNSDEWKLDRSRVVAAAEFGQWVHEQRTAEPLEDALLTTIASEIYNHGEYTFVAPLFRSWLNDFCSIEPSSIQSTMAYILVHTGSTESDHFLHCVEAFEQYAKAKGESVNYAKMTAICRYYLRKVAAALDGINMCLNEDTGETSPILIATRNATVFGA